MKWEYFVIQCGSVADTELNKLDKFGADGWELISATENQTLQRFTLFFKRPKH
jgi:hypothetical protein